MTVTKDLQGEALTVKIAGRLDTATAPQLQDELTDLTGVKNLLFDFSELEYVSSAGLRVILSTQKVMNRQGSMVITHVNDTIMEVFEITGFADILTIQ